MKANLTARGDRAKGEFVPKKTEVPSEDPTRPFTPIEISGKKYKACFDLNSLAVAEARLIAAGYDVNLLFCLPRLNLGNTRVLLAASLIAYHPDLDFEESQELLTRDNAVDIVSAMLKVWEKSTPEEKTVDPQRPAL